MCPSEVSDVQNSIWKQYKDRGVVVWAIASAEQDDGSALAAFITNFGIEMPVLEDPGGVVRRDYDQGNPFPTGAYPQQWIVGTDGRIAYVHNEFEYDAVVAILEAELAEAGK